MVFIQTLKYNRINMKTITAEELTHNVDTYILLAEKEEIKVIDGDKTLFYLIPKRMKSNNH